jgi:dTDP-4-amino-4,6-dideoxygalactose transaminase
MSNPLIPVFKPFLGEPEIAASREALELGWLGMGAYVGKFENALKAFCGASDRHVVAVSTGHAALHLALVLIGAGPGDEIITPSFNNAADFQAIIATGAAPVFCDIDADTLCVDLDKAEKLVTPRTRAVIVMDYDCILCDHDAVTAFAKKHGIRVIHDAAHTFGSHYKGKKVGSFSDMTMFSFDPVKTITCIDGGALIVRTEEEKAKLHAMRLLGMTQPSSVMYSNARAWTYDIEGIGFRYHMANLHAAIGLAQLGKIDTIVKGRREACQYYNAQFADVKEIAPPKTGFAEVTPFLYYLRVTDGRRDEFRKYLFAQGVDTGIHWQPGHWFSLFKNCRRGDLSVTERIGNEIVSLPLHSDMTRETQDRVVTAVKSFFAKA